MKNKAFLLLADGLLIEGIAIGKRGTTGGELCFNTGMTGYQEIYTDPSYYGQIVINTTPHIGNYGSLDAEQESDKPTIKGLVVRNFSHKYSRSIAQEGMQSYLEKHNIVGIADVDTRMLVRRLRNKGAMNAVISSYAPPDTLQTVLDTIPSMTGLELASKVSTTKKYFLGSPKNRFKVAVLDLGIKKSILKNLVERQCYCQVFPANTPFSTMQQWEPDGYFISNGPGDPAAMPYAINTLKEILNIDKPLFGICLGHQLLARACGIPTYKMPYGHRGLNHPVKNLNTGLCEITSQNHGFAVDRKSIENQKKIEITHVHLNNNTVMGMRVRDKRAFSVQYHPEASPGPHDSCYLFDQFIAMMDEKCIKNTKHSWSSAENKNSPSTKETMGVEK